MDSCNMNKPELWVIPASDRSCDSVTDCPANPCQGLCQVFSLVLDILNSWHRDMWSIQQFSLRCSAPDWHMTYCLTTLIHKVSTHTGNSATKEVLTFVISLLQTFFVMRQRRDKWAASFLRCWISGGWLVECIQQYHLKSYDNIHTYSSENGAAICTKLRSQNLKSLVCQDVHQISTWHTRIQRKPPVVTVIGLCSGIRVRTRRNENHNGKKNNSGAAEKVSDRFANIRKHLVLRVSRKPAGERNAACLSNFKWKNVLSF